MAKSMVVYESFLEATKEIDAETFKEIWLCLLRYGIEGEDPVDLSSAAKMAFTLMKPNIDANMKRRKGGCDDDADNCIQLPTNANNCPQLSNDEDVDEDEDRNPSDSGMKKKGRFTPPTRSEVRAYCQERVRDGHPAVNPEQFCDFYESNGWKVGKNTMKDWKAAVRTWEQRNKDSKPRGDPKIPTRDYDFAELERRLVGR